MDFLQLLNTNKILISDGAIGTLLESRGAPRGPAANIHAPEIVRAIHSEYIEAGSAAITTNTFCMNRLYMDTHGVEEDIEAVNRSGVDIAKSAAKDSTCVLGGVGLAGQLMEPYGAYKESQFYEAVLGQAEILHASGVDAFIIETITDLREGVVSVKACKENFALPVIISVAYTTARNGGRTMMGDKASDCAEKLQAAGADVIGLNCGEIDPREAWRIIETCRAASPLPLLAQPNGGKPRLDGDRTVYDMSPETFAKKVALPCLNAGAKIIGGCCGTTPAHIRAVAKLVSHL